MLSDEELRRQIADLQKQVEAKRVSGKTKEASEIRKIEEQLNEGLAKDIEQRNIEFAKTMLASSDRKRNSKKLMDEIFPRESVIASNPEDVALTDEQIKNLSKRVSGNLDVDVDMAEDAQVSKEYIEKLEKSALQDSMENMSIKERKRMIKLAKKQGKKIDDERVYDDVLRALKELNANEEQNKTMGIKRKK